MEHRIAGTARALELGWPRIVSACPFIPPYPAHVVVPTVRVPQPPKLDPAAPLEQHAERVAVAYVGAVEKRYAKRCWVYKRGSDVRRSKYFMDFGECAVALVEHGVAPAAWCAFSVDVWRKYSASTHFPPVSWVCSGQRVDERLDWFLSELPRYDGGQAWVSDTHRDLLNRWWCMRREIQRLVMREESLAHVSEIVQRHFPPGHWDMAVMHARKEATRAKATLEREVHHGFLW